MGKYVIIMAALLSGCSEYRFIAGAGVHSNDYDSNQWQKENPIGFIRVEANSYYFDDMFFTGTVLNHESMMFENDERGFNYIGGQFGMTFR